MSSITANGAKIGAVMSELRLFNIRTPNDKMVWNKASWYTAGHSGRRKFNKELKKKKLTHNAHGICSVVFGVTSFPSLLVGDYSVQADIKSLEVNPQSLILLHKFCRLHQRTLQKVTLLSRHTLSRRLFSNSPCFPLTSLSLFFQTQRTII